MTGIAAARARRWWFPLRVAGVLAAAFMALAAWAVSSPLSSSPDDDYHLTSIWCPPPQATNSCAKGVGASGSSGVLVPESVAQTSCYRFEPTVSGACTSDYSDDRLTLSTRVDDGDYPGPYYRLMHVFVGERVARSVLVMRLANSALAVLLLGVIVAGATRPQRRLLAYAVLCSVVPLSLFLVASVNPSSWAISGVASAFLATWLLPEAGTRGRLAVLAGSAVIGALAASFARADAGAYLAVLSAAALFGRWRSWLRRPFLISVPLAVGLIGAGAFLGARQSSVLTQSDRHGELGEQLAHNLTEIPRFMTAAVGSWPLGWNDTPMPAAVLAGGLLVLSAVVVLGVGALELHRGLTAGFVALVYLGLPLKVLSSQGLLVGNSVQPRYVLPLMIPLVVLVLGTGVDTPTFSRRQAWLLWAGLVTANAAALHANLSRYLGGVLRPRGTYSWWWTGLSTPGSVWLVGTISFALAAFAMVVVSAPTSDATSCVPTRATRAPLPTDAADTT